VPDLLTPPRRRAAAAPPRDVRGVVAPATLVRLSLALAAVCAAEFAVPVPGSPWARLPLLGLALLLAPVDALPALMVFTARDGAPVLGALNPADVVGLVYLARIAAGRRLSGLRITRSRVLLAAFLGWSALVTVIGVGVLTAIPRIALYAAVGTVLAHRARGRRWLYAGVVGYALVEIVLHLPAVPARLWGHFIGDPAQAGALFVAALAVVVGSRPPRPAVRAVLVAALLAGVAMTLTRSVWFAAIIVLVCAFLPRRRYLPVLLPPVAAAAALPLVPAINRVFGLSDSSADVRLMSIESGLREFAERPLTGHGWAFDSAVRAAGLVGFEGELVYNLWLFIGVSAGLVGIVLFGAFIVSLSREVLHAPAAYLSLAALLAMSLTEMPLYGLSLPGMLFFLLTPGCAGDGGTSRR
jgi:hypothetical protein